MTASLEHFFELPSPDRTANRSAAADTFSPAISCRAQIFMSASHRQDVATSRIVISSTWLALWIWHPERIYFGRGDSGGQLGRLVDKCMRELLGLNPTNVQKIGTVQVHTYQVGASHIGFAELRLLEVSTGKV